MTCFSFHNVLVSVIKLCCSLNTTPLNKRVIDTGAQTTEVSLAIWPPDLRTRAAHIRTLWQLIKCFKQHIKIFFSRLDLLNFFFNQSSSNLS